MNWSYRSEGDPTQALVGTVPFALYVKEGDEELVFVTSTGMVGFTTDADCCSETWFADITGVSSLLGAMVNSVEWLELDQVDDGRSRQQVDEFYGFRIHTTLGSSDVLFRNSSNGYYGGSLDAMREVPAPEGKQWTRIEKDWRA